ncbi:MAG: UV DNA damage repair endonuclease UvsE, partial [Chloroflexi bacterium]|nr:UV DNA damage repair endonuclease UvsE [Chloroflexota bacterium]
MRLGFPVKILSRSGLRNHDGRRWQNRPHLSVSLAYLRDIFLYLDSQHLHMYRLSSELAPYITHPDLPQFHDQIEECADELQSIGEMARALHLRLSFHAPAHVLLNSPNPHHRHRSQTQLNALAHLLDAMHLGPEAVIIIHVGGLYGGRKQALAGFIRGFSELPAPTQARLALEHDHRHFDVSDCLWLHERTGLRLVFDLLHHQLHNPQRLPLTQALAA